MHVASRRLLTTAVVALLHGAALWGLQRGPQVRPAELLVPVAAFSEWAQAAPRPEPRPEAPPTPMPTLQPPVAAPRPPAPAERPTQVAGAAALASPASPEAVPGAAAEATGAPVPTVAAAPVPAGPDPAPTARVEPPSSDAAYLQNPRPAYPTASKRLGEQGKVLVRVLIAADGTAQKAEIGQSSGFDRLDQAALQAALKWRYVPGKRAGVPEAMWWSVPINFVLE